MSDKNLKLYYIKYSTDFKWAHYGGTWNDISLIPAENEGLAQINFIKEFEQRYPNLMLRSVIDVKPLEEMMAKEWGKGRYSIIVKENKNYKKESKKQLSKSHSMG